MREVKENMEVIIWATKVDGDAIPTPDVTVPVKWWLIYLRCLIVNCDVDVVDLLG